MKTRTMFLCAVFAAALVAIVGCSSQAASSASASASASTGSVSASASASSASASSGTEVLGNEDTLDIVLDYSAGTGYEWKYTIEPEGVMVVGNKQTKDAASSGATAGGPLQDIYTLKAAGPGECVVTFKLVRDGGGEPAETQTYAFTVDSNLKATLNPYKSTFVNEPVWWGSNS